MPECYGEHLAVARGEQMQQLGTSMAGTPLTALAIGAGAVTLGFVLGGDDMGRFAMLPLGAWLILAALTRYVAPGDAAVPESVRRIPIRFSGGLGRFTVRSHGDGRHVEVLGPGKTVVAELFATHERDELVVDFGLADDPDVDAFGAAIGLAIEMVAAADEELPESREDHSTTATGSPAILGAWCRD
jgi:hypothetical protein